MAALRTVLFLVFQFVTVVPWAIGCLLLAPAPLRWRYRFTIRWPRMVIWAARTICGVRWQVTGLGNLPAGPTIPWRGSRGGCSSSVNSGA